VKSVVSTPVSLLNRLRRSVALRLSLWFAGLFTVGFSAIFALLYFTLARELEARDGEALQLRLAQYAGLYASGGLDGLRARVSEDSQLPNVKTLFIRMVGTNGSVVWGKVPQDWIDQDVKQVTVPNGFGGWNVQNVYTLRVPRDEQQDFAIVQRVMPDGVLMQLGRTTDSRQVLLAPLRNTFLWVGSAVMVVGFGAGTFAAFRATRPLRNVVETARRIIAQGDLEARVPTPRRSDDIAELVGLFNTVLDKNSGLLRAMREALDNVAHDLRTPLTRLRGSAELALQSSAEPAAAGEALADCVEQADEVLRLLRALMEISEAEAGMLKLEKTPCDLCAIARGATELYPEVAEARRQRLTFEGSGPVPVSADDTRLRQAAANLIDNALKYTPPGGQVTVGARTEAGAAVLEVRDSGPGVPAAEQPRIWERLYRGDQSRSQRGLGLGLSLVRAIVEAHGGKAEVRNAPDGGAIFTLRLPLAAG